MPVFDILLGLILLLFLINGYRKGLIGGLLQLAGILLVFALLGKYAPMVRLGLMAKWHLGPILASICSYLLILILIAILIQIIRMAMEHLLKLMQLSFINRALGGVFGLLGGLFLFAILLVLIDLFPFSGKFDTATSDSKVIQVTRLVKGELLGVVKKHDVVPKLTKPKS